MTFTSIANPHANLNNSLEVAKTLIKTLKSYRLNYAVKLNSSQKTIIDRDLPAYENNISQIEVRLKLANKSNNQLAIDNIAKEFLKFCKELYDFSGESVGVNNSILKESFFLDLKKSCFIH